MRVFREFDGRVTIQDSNGLRFSCPVDEFLAYEPDYTAVSSPYISRYWTESIHYVSTGQKQRQDSFYTVSRLVEYCGKYEIYQAAYDAAHPSDVPDYTIVYVSLSISGGDGLPVPGMYPDDNTDVTLQTLSFSGTLLSDPDDAASVILVSNVWRVPIFQVAREKFVWEAAYNPMIVGAFQQQIDIEDGTFNLTDFTRDVDGVYMISDESFELIDGALFGVSGTYYKVSIIDGPKFFKVIAGEKIKKDK